jgi:zinc D-Ala-D-Ala carboxypeptidase
LGQGVNDIKLSPNFTLAEFACRCCGAVRVDPELVRKLQQLRDRIGNPISITSGYRCPAHNKAVGGVEDSQHLLGKAADIMVKGIPASTVAEAAEKVGFGGIGCYSTFTHVDVREGFARWSG